MSIATRLILIVALLAAAWWLGPWMLRATAKQITKDERGGRA